MAYINMFLFQGFSEPLVFKYELWITKIDKYFVALSKLTWIWDSILFLGLYYMTPEMLPLIWQNETMNLTEKMVSC